MGELSERQILEALNSLDHQVLAHEVFMKCYAKALKAKDVSGFNRSSPFRMSLAYFLLVPDAPGRFRAELKARLDHQASPPRTSSVGSG